MMNKIPLEAISANPENYATARLLEDGELHIINGRHRLMAQLELSGTAEAVLVESGKIVRIQKLDNKLIVAHDN